MIHLVNIAKSFETAAGTKVIIRPIDLSIPTDRRVGILGRNGAGKSTLLKLIAGVEEPTQGRITSDCSISWPVGFAAGMYPEFNAYENIEFVARIYDADVGNTIKFVQEFSELGEDLRLPIGRYSSGMKSRLLFSTSMAIHFDCYLLDEITAVGDARFRLKCMRLLMERSGTSGIVYVSHNELSVRRICEMAIVIYRGHLIPFVSMDEAIDFYNRTSAI
jgi:capsular polysaccharide transport system ATP-binding protein